MEDAELGAIVRKILRHLSIGFERIKGVRYHFSDLRG